MHARPTQVVRSLRAVLGSDHHDRLDAARHQNARLRLFPFQIVTTRIYEDRDARLFQLQLQPVHHPGIDRMIQCRNDKPDQPGFLRSQRPRSAVGDVAQL